MKKTCKIKRTHYCTDVSLADIGKEVVVCGFVQKQRDKGNLVFVDIRDRSGIIQLSFNSDTETDVFETAKFLRSEYVVIAKGIVSKRESSNPNLKTGQVEIFPNQMFILSEAKTPPFHILDDLNVKDDLRLKYRYLDLRRPSVQNNIIFRHKVTKLVRDYFDDNGFIEVETPLLIKSTPEGARDYLIPSRLHKGSFFALPQSPQIFKQLLMLSGFDRYMQIAKCFRDEDLRSDRQPEFTQIDLEMSFVDIEDIFSINEGFIKHLFKTMLDVDVPLPIERMTYKDAIEFYGTDKPDTRFDLKLVDLSDILKDTEFKVFSQALENNGSIKGIVLKGICEKVSRKDLSALTDFVKTYGAKGLCYSKIMSEQESSNYEKFLTLSEISNIRERFGCGIGDLILIVSDTDNKIVSNSLAALRCKVAEKFDLIPENKFNFVWITEFPLFEFDQEAGRYVSVHHPFTDVHDDDIDYLDSNPAMCRSKGYDLVLNGYEIGGGSIRINNSQIQNKVFEILGLSAETINERFGFLIDAFKYGIPPHGGIAYGLDRILMLMLGCDSIRDVIAFPKVQNSSDLMMNSPSTVDSNQLDELGIYLEK